MICDDFTQFVIILHLGQYFIDNAYRCPYTTHTTNETKGEKMKGADEYYDLFKETHQKGKLYFVVSSHARGKTFRVFIIPNGEKARPNGCSNAPLNKDKVEVYGVVSGQCGWSEAYGWLHKGPWQDDFNAYVIALKEEKINAAKARLQADIDRKKRDREKLEANLNKY